MRNPDDSPVLLPQGESQDVMGLNIAAIGGIWAKSHAKPHYVTDEDVAEAADRIARRARWTSSSPTAVRSGWPT